MKNFTNNFKQFTSRLSARWLIMALMLLLGTSSAWGWTVYYDNTETKWSNVYVVLGHDSYHRGDYKMTKVSDSENLYYLTKDDWGDAKYVTFSNTIVAQNGSNSGFKTAITSGYYSFNNGASSLNHLLFKKNGTNLTTIEGLYPRLIFNCNHIGFYVGEYQNWGNQQFYVHTQNSDHISSISPFKDGTTSYYGVVYATSKKYNITHIMSWNGPALTISTALGYAYLVTDDNSIDASKESTALSCNFSIDNTIKAGETTTVLSNSTSGKSYFANNANKKYEVDSYYVKKSGETSLTKLEVEGSELQTQSLAVGEYTIYVLLFDGRIYAKGGEQTLTVETACEKPYAPSITINHVYICSGESAIIEAGQIDDAILYSLYKGNNDAPAQTNNTGIFEVREAASYRVTVTTCGESKKSSFVTLSEKPGPTASNYVIKDASKSKEYTGNEQTLTTEDITVNNNAGAVVSVYFKQNGNTVNPINVGEYDVYVTTVATDDICAGDIKIGTFTITCPGVDAPEIDVNNTITEIIKCGNGYTQKAQIAITNANDPTYTYTCTLNDNSIDIPNDGIIKEITTHGTYTITATNGCGNNASTEVEISLTDNTVSISAITGSETICSGSSQNYSVTVIEDVEYKWSINPDSEFTLGTNGNNSIEVTAKGDKEASASLSLTVTKNGCETPSNTKTITLIPLPTITTVDPTSGKACSNTTIADLEAGLTITKSDNSDTKWYFNREEQDITSTLLQGDYTIKAISKTGECLSTQGIIYTVTEVETSPAVPFNDGTEGVICGSVKEFSLTELSGWDAEAGEKQGIKILWYTDSYTPTDDVQTDIKAGTYYARTLNGDCYSDYVALNIGEPKIPNPITLTKDKESTTPWIPIKVTVSATDGTYTLSYPDNLNTVKNIQITKDGNDYTYLIPRPKAWGTGNDDKQPSSYKQVKYTVRATGNQGQCPDMGEITITLKDENNDTCNWKK